MAFSVKLGPSLPSEDRPFADKDCWLLVFTVSNTAATEGDSSLLELLRLVFLPGCGCFSLLADPGGERFFSAGLISSFSSAVIAAEKESFPPSLSLPHSFCCCLEGVGEVCSRDLDGVLCGVVRSETWAAD